MKKAEFHVRTFFFVLLPICLAGFNISLSFPSVLEDAPSTEVNSIENQHATLAFGQSRIGHILHSNGPAFGKEMGKNIKETRIKDNAYQIKTVVIDAGHGGHDPGCLGRKSREKYLALAIAQKLKRKMAATHPSIRIIMTRDKDVFVPLHERAAIANRNNADLFISIHCNYIRGSRATRGSETYVMGLHTADHNLEVAKRENNAILLEANYEKNYDYDPNSPEGHIMLSMFQNAHLEQSILFANKVEEKFATVAQRRSRGVKQAGFVVLKETTMPSVLIEAGFLSNSREEQYLRTQSGQESIAKAILTAFNEYKKITEEGIKTTEAYPSPPQAVLTPRSPSQPDHKPAKVFEGFQPETDFGKRQVIVHQNTRTEPNYRTAPIGRTITSKPIDFKIENRVPSQLNGSASTSSNQIQFHVQLAASPTPINTNIGKWKTSGYLIEVLNESKLYKYQARNFKDYYHALKGKSILRKKGFSDAFIVAYKNGQRIPLPQAKKELGLE